LFGFDPDAFPQRSREFFFDLFRQPVRLFSPPPCIFFFSFFRGPAPLRFLLLFHRGRLFPLVSELFFTFPKPPFLFLPFPGLALYPVDQSFSFSGDFPLRSFSFRAPWFSEISPLWIPCSPRRTPLLSNAWNAEFVLPDSDTLRAFPFASLPFLFCSCDACFPSFPRRDLHGTFFFFRTFFFFFPPLDG